MLNYSEKNQVGLNFNFVEYGLTDKIFWQAIYRILREFLSKSIDIHGQLF
jgi:hypothetical protein